MSKVKAQKNGLLDEIDVGRKLVTTSTEASQILGLSLTTFKRRIKLIYEKRITQSSLTTGRFSGRDIRNVKVYNGKIANGMKPKKAREFVNSLDQLLEESYLFAKQRISIIELAPIKRTIVRIEAEKFSKELSYINPLFKQYSERSQSITEKEKEVEEERTRKLLELSFENVDKFCSDLENCGFRLSIESRVTLLMFLTYERKDEIEFEFKAKVRQSKEKEAHERPLERLKRLTTLK